ncbi:MAG: hypothetical protein J6V68_00950 [Clostridia bacterium]|nr:hypothetical protein [Clostridia bacterium]
MDFLETILNLIFGEEKSRGIKHLLENLINNNFDFLSAIKSVDMNTLLPLLTSFFSTNENSSTIKTDDFAESKVDTFDIEKISGKDLATRLNNAFIEI